MKVQTVQATDLLRNPARWKFASEQLVNREVDQIEIPIQQHEAIDVTNFLKEFLQTQIRDQDLEELAKTDNEVGRLRIDLQTTMLLRDSPSLGVNLGPFLRNINTEVQLKKHGDEKVLKMLEGGILGGAAFALLYSFKSASEAIGNPALAAIAMVAIGAITWPSVNSFAVTFDPTTGLATAKIGLANVSP
jgi:hypothetical protein